MSWDVQMCSSMAHLTALLQDQNGFISYDEFFKALSTEYRNTLTQSQIE